MLMCSVVYVFPVYLSTFYLFPCLPTIIPANETRPLPFFFSFLTSCGSSNNSSASTSPANYIENKGSDTIVNLALAWAEKYQGDHPDIRISVTGGGSGTGIAALVNGTVDIANASARSRMKNAEAQANGVILLNILLRATHCVIVNPENPVNELTLQQISDIYSGKYTNWTEVGGEDRRSCVYRAKQIQARTYILETVLRLGSKEDKTLFSMDTLLLPSSEDHFRSRDNPNAIGYDGLGYVPDDLKTIAIAKEEGVYVLPSIETVNDKSYAIARDLYMYTNGEPTGIVKDIRLILSDEAQVIACRVGFCA